MLLLLLLSISFSLLLGLPLPLPLLPQLQLLAERRGRGGGSFRLLRGGGSSAPALLAEQLPDLHRLVLAAHDAPAAGAQPGGTPLDIAQA